MKTMNEGELVKLMRANLMSGKQVREKVDALLMESLMRAVLRVPDAGYEDTMSYLMAVSVLAAGTLFNENSERAQIEAYCDSLRESLIDIIDKARKDRTNALIHAGKHFAHKIRERMAGDDPEAADLAAETLETVLKTQIPE